MTARTYTPSLSLSIATYSTCDSVWLGDDAFLPLLLTFDDQSPATGQRSLPSTREVGVDVSHKMCYHLTYIDTQLSKIKRPLPPIPRPEGRFRANGSHPPLKLTWLRQGGIGVNLPAMALVGKVSEPAPPGSSMPLGRSTALSNTYFHEWKEGT
jgi:hypothetical protein